MEPKHSARTTPRRALRWLITLTLLLLVIGFASDTLRDGWQQLSTADVSIEPGWCVLSAVFYGLGLAPMALFWWLTLRQLDQHPTAAQVARGYYLGHLGKYVPGKALVVVLRTGLLTSAGWDLRRVALSVFVETLTFMATGAALAAALLFTLGNASALHMALAITLAALVGLPVTPPVARFLAKRLGVAPGGEPNHVLAGLTWRLSAMGVACSLVTWTLLGLSLWASLRALGVESAEPITQLGLWVESVTLPYVAGFLSLVPGGLFIRDALLVELLAPHLAADTALLAATLWRVISLVSEVTVCAILEASRLRLAK